jgi:hypothetical protein
MLSRSYACYAGAHVTHGTHGAHVTHIMQVYVEFTCVGILFTHVTQRLNLFTHVTQTRKFVLRRIYAELTHFTWAA